MMSFVRGILFYQQACRFHHHFASVTLPPRPPRPLLQANWVRLL